MTRHTRVQGGDVTPGPDVPAESTPRGDGSIPEKVRDERADLRRIIVGWKAPDRTVEVTPTPEQDQGTDLNGSLSSTLTTRGTRTSNQSVGTPGVGTRHRTREGRPIHKNLISDGERSTVKKKTFYSLVTKV